MPGRYLTEGNFVLSTAVPVPLTVYDKNGLQSSATVGTTVTGSFQYYSIGGQVFAKNGTTPIIGAAIAVKRGGVLVANLTSGLLGKYATAAIRPGTYTLTATKAGYIFASPTATVTTPPGTTTTNLVATGP